MTLLGLGRRQRGALEFMKNRLDHGLYAWEADFSPRVLRSLMKRGLVTVEAYPWSFNNMNVVRFTLDGRQLAEHWTCQNTGGK